MDRRGFLRFLGAAPVAAVPAFVGSAAAAEKAKTVVRLEMSPLFIAELEASLQKQKKRFNECAREMRDRYD